MTAFILTAKRLPICVIGSIVFLLSFNSAQGQTQRKQLTPSNRVQKTAYIDHSRLRKEFNAMKASRDSARTEWQALQQKRASQQLQKQWQQKRDTTARLYERKIMTAISQVVAEEGLTDIQPLHKDSLNHKNNDITDKVLRKLN